MPPSLTSPARRRRAPFSPCSNMPTCKRPLRWRRRASMRGKSKLNPRTASLKRKRALSTSMAPKRRSCSNCDAPLPAPGRRPKPSSRHCPSAVRCSSRSGAFRRNSVSGIPGHNPEYTLTCNCALSISSTCGIAPMRSPESENCGPARFQRASTAVSATGSPIWPESQRATASGWRASTGRNWLAKPTHRAARITSARRLQPSMRRSRRRLRRKRPYVLALMPSTTRAYNNTTSYCSCAYCSSD